MHKYAVYAAYGFLTSSGTLHFVIDVLSFPARRAGSEHRNHAKLNAALFAASVLAVVLSAKS
jgi:hypothetical protein